MGNFAQVVSYTSTNNIACVNCIGSHYIQKCDDFLKRNTTQRMRLVKTLKVCTNCLKRVILLKTVNLQNAKSEQTPIAHCM